VLAPDAKGYAVLAEFVRRVNAPPWQQVVDLPPVVESGAAAGPDERPQPE